MNVTLPGYLQMLLALYGYLLPLLLYVVWSTLALWDLGRREGLSAGAVWLWALAVFLLPFAGALAGWTHPSGCDRWRRGDLRAGAGHRCERRGHQLT